MFSNSSVTCRATRLRLPCSGVTSSIVCGLLGLLTLPACSDNYLTDGQVLINTGQESDAWSRDPAAKSVLLEMVQGTTRTTLAKVPAPATSISIGTGGPQNTIASFETSAFDANDNVVMKGSTVPFGLLGFEDATIAMFMGRVGGLSRAPGNLVFPWRKHPQMVVLYHGYLLISGGDEGSPNLDVYDMARWVVAAQQTPLPRVPGSWAISKSNLLIIDENGADWLDLTTSETSAVAPPSGLDYEKVVGGATIGAPGDPQYIVGATRASGKATDQVLRVDADGTLHLLKLNTPRLAAAAAIVNGKLLVVGGSDTGAGAEVENSDGTAFSELPFEADAKQGAALVGLDENTVILAGGSDPASADEIAGFRTMDLSCSESCSQVAIAKADFAFTHPRLFKLSDDQLLAVGEDPTTEETHVFTFDTGLGHALNEFALRTPRTSASAFMLPNGQVGVLGGTTLDDDEAAPSLELFFPQP